MTDNHNYNVPSKGTTDWASPLNQNFAALDSDVEIRDTAQNRSQYKPKQNAKFLATDTGERFIGDGSSWQKLPYPGSDGGTTKGYSGSRPLVSTGRVSITVASDGSGDYQSIQDAIDNEFPWLLRHKFDINVKSGTYDEHVIVPPYMANWASQAEAQVDDTAERIPIQITGDQNTPSNVKLGSITFTGGIGAAQVRGFRFTSNTQSGGIDDESAHMAVYNTYRAVLVNCESNGNAKRFIMCYNGQSKANDCVCDSGLKSFVKVKNHGVHMEQGSGKISGSVSGPVYNLDTGHIYFNTNDTNTVSGGNGMVRKATTSNVGWAHDAGNNRTWGTNGLVVTDQSNGREYEITVDNGNVTANEI